MHGRLFRSWLQQAECTAGWPLECPLQGAPQPPPSVLPKPTCSHSCWTLGSTFVAPRASRWKRCSWEGAMRAAARSVTQRQRLQEGTEG